MQKDSERVAGLEQSRQRLIIDAPLTGRQHGFVGRIRSKVGLVGRQKAYAFARLMQSPQERITLSPLSPKQVGRRGEKEVKGKGVVPNKDRANSGGSLGSLLERATHPSQWSSRQGDLKPAASAEECEREPNRSRAEHQASSGGNR